MEPKTIPEYIPPNIEIYVRGMSDDRNPPHVRENYRLTLQRIQVYIANEIKHYDTSKFLSVKR